MTLSIKNVRIIPRPSKITPAIFLDVDVGNDNPPKRVFDATGEFFILDAKNDIRVYCGKLTPVFQHEYEFKGQQSSQLRFSLEFTHQGLNAIEEIRQGNKLRYRVEITFSYQELPPKQDIHRYWTAHEEFIEKSFWLEDILSTI